MPGRIDVTVASSQVVSRSIAAPPIRLSARVPVPSVTTTSTGGGGTFSPPALNLDFSTGDFSQWTSTGAGAGVQDSTNHANTSSAWFGPLNLIHGYAGFPGWVGQFNIPTQTTIKQRCQVITSPSTPIRMNVDDYYTLRLYVDPGWLSGNKGWPSQIIEPNFQALGTAQQAEFTMTLTDKHLGVRVLSGMTPYGTANYQYRSDSEGSNNNLPVMLAIPDSRWARGVWHELIVHINWRFDTSGRIDVWHRPRGTTAWTQTVSQGGIPTLQQRPDGTYNKTTSSNIQYYRGPSQPSGLTYTTIYLTSHTRCAALADAQGYMG